MTVYKGDMGTVFRDHTKPRIQKAVENAADISEASRDLALSFTRTIAHLVLKGQREAQKALVDDPRDPSNDLDITWETSGLEAGIEEEKRKRFELTAKREELERRVQEARASWSKRVENLIQ